MRIESSSTFSNFPFTLINRSSLGAAFIALSIVGLYFRERIGERFGFNFFATYSQPKGEEPEYDQWYVRAVNLKNDNKHFECVKACQMFLELYKPDKIGASFDTSKVTAIQDLQKQIMPFFTFHHNIFTPQQKGAKIDEKRDGNCGYNSNLRQIRFLYENSHQDLIERIYPLLEKDYSKEIRTLLENTEDDDEEARRILRHLVSDYIAKNFDEYQFWLDETICSDVIADLDKIMFEVATEVNRAESTNSEINLETITDVLDKNPHFLTPMDASQALGFYHEYYKDYVCYEHYKDAHKGDTKRESEWLFEKEMVVKEQLINDIEPLRFKYLDKIKQDLVWMQNLELMVVSKLFGYKVCVIRDDEVVKNSDEIYEQLQNGNLEALHNNYNSSGKVVLIHEEEEFEHWMMIHHCDNGSHFEYIIPPAIKKDEKEEID